MESPEYTKHIRDFRSDHDVLTRPLTASELTDKRRKDGTVKVKVKVELFDLIGQDMEWLNDEVSEKITGSTCGLTAIGYRLAGRTTDNETILEVIGNVDDVLEEIREAKETGV